MSPTSADTSVQPLYAMQVRCGTRRLILPRNAIAELKPFAEPEPLQSPKTRELISSAEPWILGSIIYRDLPIPAINLAMLIDGAAQPAQHRARYCIMHAIGHDLNPPLYAIICQGFPSLLEVPGQLGQQVANQTAPNNPDNDNPYIAAHIQLGGYLCAVPNLPEIEQHLAQALNKHSDD